MQYSVSLMRSCPFSDFGGFRAKKPGWDGVQMCGSFNRSVVALSTLPPCAASSIDLRLRKRDMAEIIESASR